MDRTDLDIARWRLCSQRLTAPHATSASAVVSSLLAVQAENPGQAAWAVASRTVRPAQDDLAALLDEGRVLRTHVLRPTWHFVSADDIGWLLDVTAPRVRPIIARQLRDTHDLDGRRLDRAAAVVSDAVAEHGQLTRSRLADELRAGGVDANGNLVMLLLAHLELDGVLCSGPPDGGEHTYALLERRAPDARRLDRAEALAELALRYFTGHGPATERDLAYWATLTLTDVRTGIEQVRDRLGHFEHDGRTYWHAADEKPPARRRQQPRAQLLQILDECYRGYQDSRWVLDAGAIVPRAREAAIGMALVDAQIVGSMRRTVSRSALRLDVRPFRPLLRDEVRALEAAASRYGDFLAMEPRLVLPQGEVGP